MKRRSVSVLLAVGVAGAGSIVLAQAPRVPVRTMASAVSVEVQVMTSDVVAAGRVEDAGGIEELDVVMPLTDKRTKHRFQKFRLFAGKIIRDTAGGAPVFSNPVVEVLAALPPAVTNAAGCAYQKDMRGVFLMHRLAGRKELLLARHKEPINEAMIINVAASVEGLSWGQVSNGLQMAALPLSAVMASTNESSMRLGVAVRNVSNAPIAVNRAQVQKRLTVAVDGKEATLLDSALPALVASNAAAPQAIIILLANQIAMLAPKGNPDSGFAVKLPSGEAWSVRATYEPIGEKEDDPPFWRGRLESGDVTVKAFKPPVRPLPRIPRSATPVWQKPAPSEAAPEVSPQSQSPAPENKPFLPAPPQ